MSRDLVKGHLDFLLLATLSAAPAHGYAVMTALRERSNGAFGLTEGAVYPALHRLEDRGLVTSDWREVNGRRRREYRITAKGSARLGVEGREWSQMVTAVDAVLRAAKPALAGGAT